MATPFDIVVENRTSEPRDMLMAERTMLSWVRFATVLALAVVALLLEFRFDTSSSPEQDFIHSKAYAITVGTIFGTLSIVGILVALLNYHSTVTAFVRQRTGLGSPIPMAGFVVCVVVVLLGVSISLMV